MRINRNTLFLTELVLNVLIFALCAGGCALLLVRANALSRQSQALTAATYIAQIAAAHFDGQDMVLNFDDEGNLRSEKAAYTAQCRQSDDVLTVEVFDSTGRSIYTLETWGEYER